MVAAVKADFPKTGHIHYCMRTRVAVLAQPQEGNIPLYCPTQKEWCAFIEKVKRRKRGGGGGGGGGGKKEPESPVRFEPELCNW